MTDALLGTGGSRFSIAKLIAVIIFSEKTYDVTRYIQNLENSHRDWAEVTPVSGKKRVFIVSKMTEIKVPLRIAAMGTLPKLVHCGRPASKTMQLGSDKAASR